MKKYIQSIKDCYTQNPKRFWISTISSISFIIVLLYLVRRKKTRKC